MICWERLLFYSTRYFINVFILYSFEYIIIIILITCYFNHFIVIIEHIIMLYIFTCRYVLLHVKDKQ